jgi:hypothetical protein
MFVLTLEPIAGEADAESIRRLRAVLKRLLRDHGFRCVHVVEYRAPQGSEVDEAAPV